MEKNAALLATTRKFFNDFLLCGGKGSFRRSVVVLTSGAAIGQVLIILSSPIITRFYTPSNFGSFTLYCTVINLLIVIASLKYEAAIPLPKDDSVSANLVALSFLVLVLISGLSILLLFTCADAIRTHSTLGKLSSYTWLLPITLLLAGVYQICNSWAVRKTCFSAIAKTRFTQSLGQVVVQIGAGLCSMGLVGLIIGDLIGRFSGISVLGRSMLNTGLTNNITFAGMKSAAIRYRTFPLVSSVSSLLNAAALQLPFFLFGTYFGPEVLGLFALSHRVIGGPLTLLGTSVGQVYLSEASMLRNESPEGMTKLLHRTSRKLFVVGLIPIVALALMAQWLFPLLFGKNWYEAGIYLQLLSPMFLLQFVVVPVSQTLNVLERQGLQFVWDLIRICFIWLTLFVAHSINCTPREVIGVFSFAMSVSYIFLFAIIAVACAKASKTAANIIPAEN